jgi:hypothetical protein
MAERKEEIFDHKHIKHTGEAAPPASEKGERARFAGCICRRRHQNVPGGSEGAPGADLCFGEFFSEK